MLRNYWQSDLNICRNCIITAQVLFLSIISWSFGITRSRRGPWMWLELTKLKSRVAKKGNSQEIQKTPYKSRIVDLMPFLCWWYFLKIELGRCYPILTTYIQLDCLSVRSWNPRHNFCCRDPILNPRLVLDSSVQTTRGMLLDFL